MNQRVAAWLTWLEHEKGREPNTRKLYERTVLMLERETASIAPLEELQTSDLHAWLHSKSGSTGSYANRVAALRSFYGYLADRRMIVEDPTRRLEIPKRSPSAREPVRNLASRLAQLDELDSRVGRRVGESRDMAVFLAQTGMRISDACRLSVAPPVPESISLPRDRRPDKVIALSFEARDALTRLGGRFGIGARALQRRFEKAGFHPDQLRHWYRVNLAERDLRDDASEGGLASGSAEEPDSSPPAISDSVSKGFDSIDDPLGLLARFLETSEKAAASLVRDAIRQGMSWTEVARVLRVSERAARERFG